MLPFDFHYAPGVPHYRQCDTGGHCKLLVAVTLRCPLPSVSSGEYSAVCKPRPGTLMQFLVAGHCTDPPVCRAGFVHATVVEPITQTLERELADWVGHAPHHTPAAPKPPPRTKGAPLAMLGVRSPADCTLEATVH